MSVILAKVKFAAKWLIGRQPYTLTLDACAQTAHFFAGSTIISIARHFGLVWWAGWAILLGWVCYKEFFNDIHNEGASYKDGARDGLFYVLGGLLAQFI